MAACEVVQPHTAACEVVQPHTATAIAEVAAVCKVVNRQMTRCQRDQHPHTAAAKADVVTESEDVVKQMTLSL